MRRVFFVVLLAACSHRAPCGPAWPKMAETEPKDDGGESIAPRDSNVVAAVIEKSEEPAAKPAEAEAAAPAAATPEADDKAAAPQLAPATDEVINTEEIIIEIDDE